MKKLLFICILGVLLNPTFSQENNSENIRLFNPNFIGLSSGFTTGTGFTYRYFPDKSGMQVTFLSIICKSFTKASLGITYLKEIKEYDQARLLVYVSNHANNFSEDDHLKNNIGFGFGTDRITDDLIINFMVGYAIYDILSDPKALPTIEFGYYYSF